MGEILPKVKQQDRASTTSSRAPAAAAQPGRRRRAVQLAAEAAHEALRGRRRSRCCSLLLVGALRSSWSTRREQVIITQFGKPVGEPITDAGPQDARCRSIQKVNRVRQALPRVGRAIRNEIPTRDKRLHLGRRLRALAHHRPARSSSSRLRDERRARSRGSTTSSTARRATSIAKHDLIARSSAPPTGTPVRDRARRSR